MPRKLLYGFGLNDADYVVKSKINGKQTTCQFYQVWQCMMKRCYSKKYQKTRSSYVGCYVCPDWLTFSKFKEWMETQNWKGNQLDKDILVVGNKIYSPETCVFVSAAVNSFTLDCGSARGEFPVGVSFHKNRGKFISTCSNPFTRKQESLGYFLCQNEAHKAWRMRKYELACQLAELQINPRVAKALRERYL